MKKFYILFLVVCVISTLHNSLFSQSVLNPADSIVEYDASAPPVEPAYGTIGKWVRTKSMSWNSDAYKTYIYKGSCFRLKFPKTYNPTANDGKKYPLAIVFHGLGEAGPITDNEGDLYHGGLEYQAAVDNGVFDGYVMFMQSQGSWGTASYQKIIEIIEYMIANNKLDPFRITVNGLSAGGQASWDMLINYPTYIGASLPMSNISIGYKDSSVVNTVKFTKTWDFQGGLDGSPSPSTAQQVQTAMLAAGGNFRYREYKDIGHNTWDSAFAEPDFFTFVNDTYSADAWTLFGRTDFCNADSINVIIGVAPGFDQYQWRKNGVIIPEAVTNTLNVTSVGTYDAKVLRGSIWSDWSHKPVTVQIASATVTPAIAASKNMSNVIVAADGKNFVNLEVPGNNFTRYEWRKAGQDSILSNQKIYTANQAGKYVLKVFQQYGCSSLSSPAFSVINASGQNPPDKATNLIATTISTNEIDLSWQNNTHPLYNETFFEVYRSTSQNGTYTFIAKVGADYLSYKDLKLIAGGNYFYKIRAINNNGAAPVSNIANAATLADVTPPTAPANLAVQYATNSSISIKWDSSFDNVGIENYQVFINGVQSYTTSADSFIVNGLQQGKVYSFYVKAKDSSGNLSVQSNIASSAAVLNGLFYKYYEGYWTAVPDFNTIAPLYSGVSTNTSVKVARRTVQFGFLWQGNINIPVAGTYKFETYSDDGSKLWLNTYDAAKKPLVTNDGIHKEATYKSGTITLQKGASPISIGFFQNKNNKTMKLYWTCYELYGDTLRHEIADSFFNSNYVAADTIPAMPDNVSVTVLSYNKTKVTWSDKSNNENGFQIYRALKGQTVFAITGTVAAGVTTFFDSGLAANTQYNYKINAVNDYGTSALTKAFTIQTLKLPAVPVIAFNVKAQALSSSSIQLSWSDTNTQQVSYKIFRSVSDTLKFQTAALLPAGTNSFTDTSLYGNIAYYYKIKLVTATATSASTNAVVATTKNTTPVINNKFTQQTIRAGAETVFNIAATDSDGDKLSFSAKSLPVFATFTDNKNGTAVLKFNPTQAQIARYNNLKISVSDSLGGMDSMIFRLIVNNNYNPVLDSIADYTLNEGDNLSLPLMASDKNAGDTLSFSVSGIPANYKLVTGANRTASLILNPNYAAAGMYKITATVDDGKGGITQRQFNITINDKDPNQIVYLRFKDQDDMGAPWNDITGVNSTGFKDNLNRNTSIGLALQTSWWNTWHEGPQTGNNSGIYPDNVLKDYYYFGVFGGTETVNAKLTGLDTSKVYDVSFYGGSNWSQSADNGNTIYTIGAVSKSLHVQNNTTNTADFSSIKPAADSTISFTMAKDANASAGYVNAIVIKYVYADSLKPMAPTFLTATAAAGKGVQLNWNDNAYNEVNYAVYRSLNTANNFTLLTDALPLNTSTYFDSTTAGNTQYFYMVKAINKQGISDSSNNANVTTLNRIPFIQPVANIIIKNNQQKTITVTATDDSTDHLTITSYNLPSFATFTDNGNGTATLSVNPVNGVTGVYDNIIIKAADNSDSSSSISFNIDVTDQNANAVYINFSDGTLAPAPWNNFTSFPVANATLNNLYDDNNQPSNIAVTLTNGFQGNMAGGMQTENGKNIYPAPVMRSFLYEGSTKTDSIKISGLSTDKAYNFVFFNSHDDGLNGNTAFKINGTAVKLNASHNINVTKQINNIIPDANGNVFITVKKDPDADFAYLNALIIQSYTPDSTLLLSPSNLLVANVTKKSVSLQWADRSYNETGFEIWKATDSNSNYTLQRTVNANITNYTDTNVNSGATYYYIVRAVNSTLQSNFSNAVAATTYIQAIYVNFAFANTANVPWNNTAALPEAGLQWNNLFDDSGVPSSISMQEVNNFAGLYGAGVNTGKNSGIYPDKVMADSYGLFAGGNAQLKITGLNLNKRYDFTFFASSQASGDVNTAYIINGKKAILNASLNTNATVTIYNVVPGKNGDVIITITPNSITSQFGLIGALVIQEYATSGKAIPASPLPANKTAVVTANKQSLVTKQPATETAVQNKIAAYPNPFINDFTLSISLQKEDNVKAELYSINGKLVMRKSFGTLTKGAYNFHIVPNQNIGAGIYIMKVMYKNANIESTIKIIKQ